MFETNNSLPLHIAIIMDGNGRWAAARGLPRSAGHREGAQAVRRTLEAARDMGIKYLTLYAFSTENWTRPKEEINTLMQLLERTLDEYQKSAQKADYRVLVSGERERLPAGILAKMDELVRSTESNKGLTVHLALNYGARQEIVHAGKPNFKRRPGGSNPAGHFAPPLSAGNPRAGPDYPHVGGTAPVQLSVMAGGIQRVLFYTGFMAGF